MEEHNPLVSIITSAFNSDKTIESTINSVLSQSYPRIEYIIIDGGSTDGTLAIVNKYKSKITGFVSEPDNGVYDGMNKGIKLATGEIIGILNSDDVYASDDVITPVVKVMTETNADVCWGDLVYVHTNNMSKIIRYWRSSEYTAGKFRKGWMPPHPSFFVRRKVYENYGGFNLDFPIAADYELMLRLLERFKVKSSYIPQVMIRMREGGKSNRSFKNIIVANIQCYRAWKVNGLRICPLRIFLKPLSKIPQFFTR